MDYDTTTMPAGYVAGRSYTPAVLKRWLDVVACHLPTGKVAKIVDLGCGTGRYSAALAARFGACVVALDPSEKMLEAARAKPAPLVCFERAAGEALPLSDISIDLVFMSMVFHHFDDPDAVARECRRILRPGGRIALRAATTDQIHAYPYVPFFPRASEIMRKDLQTRAEIERVFTAAGVTLSHHELVLSEVGESWNAYADKLAYRADSILVQLSDHEFEEGLAALRSYARKAEPHESVIEPVDFFVFESCQP